MGLRRIEEKITQEAALKVKGSQLALRSLEDMSKKIRGLHKELQKLESKYTADIKKNPDLAQEVMKLRNELGLPLAIGIYEVGKKPSLKSRLQGKDEYENFHGIKISDEIVQQIVESSDRYMKNRSFPDKAFDILDESCSKMTSDGESGDLNENVVFSIVSESTGIPITTVCGEEKATLSNLKESLSKIIVGQEGAIDTISNAIKRARLGLKDPQKPIGNFIFLGPSGVGKTLLSKSLSEILFGKDRLIRLDMSEYMGKESVNKITGSSPGYIGYEDGSKLAEEIRKRPYSVLLLDEIEKAHKDVLNVFLQILDEGRMTDSFGRLVDFRNTIIIMTSNLATAELSKKSMGFEADSPNSDPKIAEKFLMEKVGKYFSPEFINRLDETVIFNKITKENVFKIFDLEFDKTEERIEGIGLKTSVTEKAKKFLCEKGYDEKYGARPMVRAIQQYLETPLASKVLSGEI